MRFHRNYLFLIPLLAVAYTYSGYYTVINLERHFNGQQIAATPFTVTTNGRAQGLTPAATEAGLKRGDRIVAAGGKQLTGLAALHAEWTSRHPGDSVDIEFIRGASGERVHGTLRLAPAEDKAHEWSDHATTALFLIMPLICLVLGTWVILARPADSQAASVFVLLLGFSSLITINDVRWLLPAGVRPPLLMYQAFTQGSWPAAMLLFGVYFPERLHWEQRLWWIKWVIVSPVIVLLLAGGYINVLAAEDVSAVAGIEDKLRGLAGPAGYLTFAMIGGCFMLLGFKMGTVKNPDARRRLRLLLYGGGFGMLPAGALFGYSLFTGRGFSGIPQPVMVAVLGMMFLFPLTLAYVIIVHRALGVGMVLRQGIQYGFARGGVRMIQVALSVVALYFAASLFTDPSANRPKRLQAIALAVLFIVLAGRAAEKLLKWIDRRFFREAYDAEQVLSELSDSVRTMVEEKPLLETVSRKISEVLHVPRVAVLLGGDGQFRPAYACGYPADVEIALPERAGTAAQLTQTREPAEVFFDDERSWIRELPEEERAALQRLGSQLLLPLATKEKLLGVLSLGPKQSEEPYSRSDVRLLKALAMQTGMALENSRLTATVAHEIAQREKLNREIEIAREVQERLFPQKLPPVEGIDYWGYCRPALGVGGDYYDFLQLPGGDFGIAIGDVSGKGIAAALLMASLQASLRSQATQDSTDLARIMRNVNRLVYDATPSNKYATFFYAQYKRATSELLFCNGGHNAPMIFRLEAGQWRVIRCEAGGPAVGLFPEVPYEMGSCHLKPGDILVGFTDGISEAMNHTDDEFGEERLEPAVIAVAGKSARDMIPSLMAAADAFADGAPQHDDMTVVVVKLLG